MEGSGISSRDKTEPKCLVTNNEYFIFCTTDPLRKISRKHEHFSCQWRINSLFIVTDKETISSVNVLLKNFYI